MFILVLVKLQIRNSLFQNRYKVSSIWQQKMHNLFFLICWALLVKHGVTAIKLVKLVNLAALYIDQMHHYLGKILKFQGFIQFFFNTEAAAIRKVNKIH